MRIGVIGLGAIGGVTAQRLLDAGFEVSLGAGRLHEEIASKFPRARVGKSLPEGEYGFLLFGVGPADPERALAPAAPLCEPDGAVVCLQNGLPEERVARIVGAQRVLGAVIGWSATMTEPGEYVITGGGKFTLGGSSPRLEHARLVLQHAFPVRVTYNLAGARWSKLAMNCAMSTLGAITGFSLGELAARRYVRTLALGIVAEVVDAARARGVTLEAVAGVRPDWLVRLPAPLAPAAVWLAPRPRPGPEAGVVARLRQGRPAGIEDLNALIDAPLNNTLVRQGPGIERGERRNSPQNLSELL